MHGRGRVICGLVGIYFEFLSNEQNRKQLTASVSARVEKTDIVRAVDPVFGSESTAYVVVDFSFTLDGKNYVRSARMNPAAARQFIPWNTAKVCYDPANPKTITEPQLFPEGYSCGA